MHARLSNAALMMWLSCNQDGQTFIWCNHVFLWWATFAGWSLFWETWKCQRIRQMRGKSDRETCPLFASRFGLRQCLVNFYGSTFVTLLKDLFANIKTFWTFLWWRLFCTGSTGKNVCMKLSRNATKSWEMSGNCLESDHLASDQWSVWH